MPPEVVIPIIAVLGVLAFLLGYSYGYEDGEDEARQGMPLGAARKPVQPSSPAPATPLPETTEEALSEHYRHHSEVVCWCGRIGGHSGPHATPFC